MDHPNKLFPYRALLLGIAGSTVLATVLRTLALFLELDDIGYFSGGALSVLTTVAQLFAAACCVCIPFLAPKGTLSQSTTPTGVGKVLCYIAALLMLLAAILLVLQLGSAEQPLFAVLALIALLFGIAYLALCGRGFGSPYALAALGLIFGAVLLISLTYFDLLTPMNAPRKTSLHLCLLAAMLYVLYEMRMSLSRPLPRALAVLAALCFSLCASMGLSNLIFDLARGALTVYTVGDLTALSCALLAASALLRTLFPAPTAHTAASDDKEDAPQ